MPAPRVTFINSFILVYSSIIQRLSRSEFSKNVATLMTGAVIAQVLPILLAPVFSRLFRPEDYGLSALYMGLSGMIAIIATGQYSQAIILPEKEADALNLMALSLALTLLCSVSVFVLIAVFRYRIASFLGSDSLADWLFLLPVSIFLSGASQSLDLWANRKKNFQRLAKVQVIQTVIISFIQLGIGLFGFKEGGLVICYVLGQCISTGIIGWRFYKEDRTKLAVISVAAAREQARQYRNFPRYTLPTEMLNVVTNQAPVFLLTKFFGATTVGHYSLTQRMLGIPQLFIANSISNVFRQRASSDYAKTGNCQAIYFKTMKSLFLLSLLPFAFVVFAAPNLFAVVFGERWRAAGMFASALGVLYFFRFTCSPLSVVYTIAGKQKEDLILHVWMILSTALAIYLGYRISSNPIYAILLFSVNYSLIYLIYLVRSYNFAGGAVQS